LWKALEAAVFLTEVTNPKTQQTAPFGTAWAAGEQQLVTTAGQAIELRSFLQDDWRVVAVRQSDQGRVAVKKATPHPEFEKPTVQGTQMFYDLGVLNLISPTGLVPELMKADQIERLPTDTEVMCLGIPKSYDPMASASSLRVQTFPGKLWRVQALRPGGPAFLQLNLDVPEHLAGSPILTGDGRVIGTYTRAALPEFQKQAGFPLHAAASVSAVAELLQQQ
jgi:hypothetical protein